MKELLALDNFVTIPHGIIHQENLLQKVNASEKYVLVTVSNKK